MPALVLGLMIWRCSGERACAASVVVFACWIMWADGV